MSRAAQDWAANRVELEAATRWTLWRLADYASPDGLGAFPSVVTLARDTGLSERTVQRHLRELERLRYIERGDGLLVSHYPFNRRPAVWNVRMQAGQVTALEQARGAAIAESTAVDNPGGGVTQVSPLRGDTDGQPGVTLLSPNPRTNKELTARARERRRRPRGMARSHECQSAECMNPNVGNGAGWLADDEQGRPRPCPVCKPHTMTKAAAW